MMGRSTLLIVGSLFGALPVIVAPAVCAELPPNLPPLLTPQTQTASTEDWSIWPGRKAAMEPGVTADRGAVPHGDDGTGRLAMLAKRQHRHPGPICPEREPAAKLPHCLRPAERADRAGRGIGTIDARTRFAMLFLGNSTAWKRTTRKQERIAAVLRHSVELTARSQSKLGGWLYSPDSSGDEGSVTVTQLQGLRACRNAVSPCPSRSSTRHEIPRCSINPTAASPTVPIARAKAVRRSLLPPLRAGTTPALRLPARCQGPGFLQIDRRKRREPRNQGLGPLLLRHLYMAQIMWLSGKETGIGTSGHERLAGRTAGRRRVVGRRRRRPRLRTASRRCPADPLRLPADLQR